MQSISPVLTDKEVEFEYVVALDQLQYYPIICLPCSFSDGQLATLTRFTFTDEERKQIANGADLILGQPHHGPMMPISLQLAMPNQLPIEA